MPISVVSQPITAVGPGFGFQIHTDLIGAIATGSTWRIEIHQHGDEDQAAVVITAPLWSSDQHNRRVWIEGDPDGGQQTFYGRNVSLYTGQSVDLLYQLLAPDGTTVTDSGATTSVVWDTDISNSRLLPTPTSGLTEEQAQQLADDHAAINPPLIAADGTAITGAVGDNIVRPALKFLGIDTTEYHLTGSGTLDVPNIAGVQTAWGLVLDVEDTLPGEGVSDGYVVRYHTMAGQFLLLWPAKNTSEAMVIDELRLHLAHRTWTWDFANVIAVAYWIQPGWQVMARFVSAFFP